MTTTITVRVTRNNFPSLSRIHFSEAHARMATYLTREIGNMFETQGASRGHRWAPLAKSTKAQKAKKGLTSEVLVRRGFLRTSFRALDLDDDHLVFGTDDKKAKFHDSELPRKRAATGKPRLPMRPLIRVLPRDANMAARFVREVIEKTAGGNLE